MGIEKVTEIETQTKNNGPNFKLSWNKKRSDLRRKSSNSYWTKYSLQQCDITDNRNKLRGQLALTNNKKRRLAILGLIAVFEETSYNGGFIRFGELMN